MACGVPEEDGNAALTRIQATGAVSEEDGNAALTRIQATEAVDWVTAKEHLSQSTRTASEYIFALAKEYATQCPLSRLLTVNFDCEQIWQQIDLQAGPLLATAKRQLRQLHNAQSLLLDGRDDTVFKRSSAGKHTESDELTEEPDHAEEMENASNAHENGFDEEDEDAPVSSDMESEPEEIDEGHPVEDKFLKLKEMERFLDEAEVPQESTSPLRFDSDGSEEVEEEGEDQDEEDDEGDFEGDDNHDFKANNDEVVLKSKDKDVKYEDFFGESKKKKAGGIAVTNNPSQSQSSLTQLESLTAHGKQLAKVQKRIAELESANLNPKLWTMQGEVSASKRPKNSALEVELDFEHNVRPPPVITEEVTASLEDLIRNRIIENNFDDVQRTPSLTMVAPKEQIELDENKSKKGLAELYEADYVQKTGLAPISSSPGDELRNEATRLLKALSIKLDALSHFHFTPKPVIEDMAVRTDVPALAMEEVAPLMVSDAQMLAPEEHFAGEGVIKLDAELTREERKRRRAKKKERGKAEKKKELHKKPAGIADLQSRKPEESSLPRKRIKHSHYSQSTKVFKQLDDESKNSKPKKPMDSQGLRAPFLKL